MSFVCEMVRGGGEFQLDAEWTLLNSLFVCVLFDHLNILRHCEDPHEVKAHAFRIRLRISVS